MKDDPLTKSLGREQMSIRAEQSDPEITHQISDKLSTKLFYMLLQRNRDAFALCDKHMHPFYISDSIQDILGYPSDECLRLDSYFDLLESDDQQQSRTLMTDILERPGKSVTKQYRIKQRDGSFRWIETTITNLLTDLAIQAIVVHLRDITEHKQREVACQREEERQRFLNEASKMLVASLDHQITLQEIAQMIVPTFADYCRIGIINAQKEIKDIVAHHIHAEQLALVQILYEQYKDRASSTHGLQKLLQTGKAELIPCISDKVLETVRDNPELLTVVNALGLTSYMGTPLIVHDRIIGAITFSSIQPHRCYTQDDLAFAQELAHRIALVLENARLHQEAREEIAERKRVEAQLRQSEELYRLVVEHTTDLITLTDLQGMIVYISPSCERLLGYKPEEMIGKMAFSMHHPDDLPQIEKEFATVLRGGMAIIPLFRIKHKNGSWVSFTAMGSAVSDEQGNPFLIISTSHDMTQHIEIERRKDDFISMASHELRTPLTSLKGFTSILQRRLAKQGDEQALYYLVRIDAQLKKLTKLISDLLDLSKIQTGKLTLEAKSFDLDTLVSETIENMQAAASTHQLLIESTSNVQLYADADRIGQVLLNLLTNAIKYSPHANKVVVKVSTDQASALISVQDFGIGIDQAHHQKIFERFYQAIDPAEQTYPGLGIGLFISQRIIQQHRGRLWVKSKRGEGATFHVSLPLQSEKNG